MARQAQQIDAQAVDIQVEKAGGLHRVGVQHDGAGKLLRPPAHGGGNFGQRVDDADFVVGVHQGNQGSAAGDGLRHRLRRNQPVGVHRQIGHLEAARLQGLADVQHGVMFDGGGDDMVAGFLQGGSHALDGGVVGFGAAAGEHHLAVAAAQHAGHPLPRLIQGVARLLPHGVDAGGVAEQLGEVGRHRLQRRRRQRRSAGVVHIHEFAAGPGSRHQNRRRPYREKLPPGKDCRCRDSGCI